jgi:DNA polymerase-3 subunit beta
MKLTIYKDVLNEAVQQVSRAISSRSTNPILKGIWLQAHAEGLTLTASDTDLSIQVIVPIENNEKVNMTIERQGGVVLTAKFFVDIIKKMPADQITIDTNEQFLTLLKSGKAELQIMGLDPEEFPVLAKVEGSQLVQVTSEVLKTQIKRTLFAVSTTESTPILTGILWTLKDNLLKFVATDRHRLSQSEVTLPEVAEQELKNVVISGQNLNELLKLLPDQNTLIDMVVTENQILFRLGRISFYTRLLDGTYPDTSKIIPQQYKSELIVDTKLFLDAIDRAYLLSREEKTNIVRLQTLSDGSLEIGSSLADLGKMTEQLEVVSFTGEALKISFNSKYMLDALKTVDSEQLKIGFTGAMSPIIVQPNEETQLLHLILPYRTTN